MATHKRQLIREAIAAALVNKTAAAGRVFTSRETVWRRVELPGLAVHVLEENVDEEARINVPYELVRDVRMAVLAVLALKEDIDDAIDSISAEIEAAVLADPRLGGLADDTGLASTEIEIVQEQDRPVGVARITFTVRYRTSI